ncbi:glycosyltransferase family 1 protein, partial [candidate division WWE3 bacterium]|nr:glycosyltransferase family 1 protein [candidate division WWE3 bacterium]
MHIGIDASRVNIDERTGTENYSYHVINALAKIDTENDYTLYFREKPKSKFFQELTNNNKNFEALVIKWPRL